MILLIDCEKLLSRTKWSCCPAETHAMCLKHEKIDERWVKKMKWFENIRISKKLIIGS